MSFEKDPMPPVGRVSRYVLICRKVVKDSYSWLKREANPLVCHDVSSKICPKCQHTVLSSPDHTSESQSNKMETVLLSSFLTVVLISILFFLVNVQQTFSSFCTRRRDLEKRHNAGGPGWICPVDEKQRETPVIHFPRAIVCDSLISNLNSPVTFTYVLYCYLSKFR